MKKKILTKDTIKVGMRVVDTEDGIIGTVKKADDPHNIFVKYDKGAGHGLYCIVPTCDHFYPECQLVEYKKSSSIKSGAR